MIATKPHIVSRTFHAPRELVWKANSEADRIGAWFSPPGFTARVDRMDFRVGGEYISTQYDKEGKIYMRGKILYKEISPIEKLVYIQSFRHENDELGSHPELPLWPRQILSTITLEDLGDNRTRMTVEWSPYRCTSEEEAFFETVRPSTELGWAGTFDKLEIYLKTAK